MRRHASEGLLCGAVGLTVCALGSNLCLLCYNTFCNVQLRPQSVCKKLRCFASSFAVNAKCLLASQLHCTSVPNEALRELSKLFVPNKDLHAPEPRPTKRPRFCCHLRNLGGCELELCHKRTRLHIGANHLHCDRVTTRLQV